MTLNRLKLSDFQHFTPEQRLELLLRVCTGPKATASDLSSVLTRNLLPFIVASSKCPADATSRVKGCLLRVAAYSPNSGLEAIGLLVKNWRASDVATVTTLEGTVQITSLFTIQL